MRSMASRSAESDGSAAGSAHSKRWPRCSVANRSILRSTSSARSTSSCLRSRPRPASIRDRSSSSVTMRPSRSASPWIWRRNRDVRSGGSDRSISSSLNPCKAVSGVLSSCATTDRNSVLAWSSSRRRTVAAATLSSSSPVKRRWRSVSRTFSMPSARCIAISSAAARILGRKLAQALHREHPEGTGSRVERQREPAHGPGRGTPGPAQPGIGREVTHLQGLSRAERPTGSGPLIERHGPGPADHQAIAGPRAQHQADARRPERCPDSLRSQVEARLEGSLVTQRLLDLEHRPQAMGALPCLVDQPAHCPTDGDRRRERDEPVDRLRREPEALDRRQDHRGLQEPRQETDRGAARASTGERGPEGRDHVQVTQDRAGLGTDIRDRHGDRGEQGALRQQHARAMRRVQLRGGARWPPARRTLVAARACQGSG